MIKVYKNDENDWVCELWEASTKHPDSIFHLKDDVEAGKFHLNPYAEHIEYNIYQWLLYVASQLTWKFHAYELADYAFEHFYEVNN